VEKISSNSSTGAHSGVHAIVVGNSNHIGRISEVLARSGISFTICKDVFETALEVAVSKADKLIVIGCILALSFENFKIVELFADKDGVKFCGISQNCPAKLAQDFQRFTTKTNVCTAASPEEVLKLIEQSSSVRADAGVIKVESKHTDSFHKKMAALADRFFLTKAEQDALMGKQK
jgi:hypothetical protein